MAAVTPVLYPGGGTTSKGTAMAYDTHAGAAGPEPVTDWANDWDWLDDQWGERAPEIWAELRAQGCTMAFTERYGRAFMPITHEAVSAPSPTTRSASRRSGCRSVAARLTGAQGAAHHHRPTRARRPAPSAAGRRSALSQIEATRRSRPGTTAVASSPRSTGRDIADAAVDYSQHIPVHVIAEMIGVPEIRRRPLPGLGVPQLPARPARQRGEAGPADAEMFEYFGALLDASGPPTPGTIWPRSSSTPSIDGRAGGAGSSSAAT